MRTFRNIAPANASTAADSRNGRALTIVRRACRLGQRHGVLPEQVRTDRGHVKNVYLVKGPNSMDGKVIRRLIFTSVDLGAKIKACATMSCSDNDLREGLEVDLVAGPRMNYWFVGNDQRVQYSGTAQTGNAEAHDRHAAAAGRQARHRRQRGRGREGQHRFRRDAAEGIRQNSTAPMN